jgi:hypothetical protein
LFGSNPLIHRGAASALPSWGQALRRRDGLKWRRGMSATGGAF